MSEVQSKSDAVFSIVVPVYNAERYLEKCIQSVANQTFKDFELVLVDDGSTDSSGHVCDQYMQRDERIKVIHQKNAGQTFARKIGLANSVGKYILFLDSDDWLHEQTLDNCFEILKKYQVDILVFGYKEYKNGKEIDISIEFPEGYYDKNRIESLIFPRLMMDERGKFFPRALWGKVFKREQIINNLNKIPEVIRNGEDMCCTVSTVLESKSLFILKDILYYYRIDDMLSLSNSADRLALKRCKVMARFLHDIICEKDVDLQEQYWRLLVQQIYSAVVRASNAIGINEEFLSSYCELTNEWLCKEAIYNARFSLEAKKLKIKQIILKYRIFYVIKYVKK